jgi:hypothetical protein
MLVTINHILAGKVAKTSNTLRDFISRPKRNQYVVRGDKGGDMKISKAITNGSHIMHAALFLNVRNIKTNTIQPALELWMTLSVK